MPNCTFDNGLEGWQTFLEAGGADFSVLQGGGECHAPLCPAAYIVTNDHFVGGLYQQVSVTPGNTYYANIIWLVFDSFANDGAVNNVVGGIGRRIGIDPTGGTDSRSSNVVWSEDNWRNDCKICGVEEVAVTAQADTITVFLRIDDTWRLRAAEKGFAVPSSDDKFWIDDIGLKQVSEGDIILPTAEPTESPPTETPAPVADTASSAAPAEAVRVNAPVDESVEEKAVSEAETTEADEVAAPPVEAEPVLEAETPPEQVVEPPPTLTPTSIPAVINTIAAPPTLTPTLTPAAAAPIAQQTSSDETAILDRQPDAVPGSIAPDSNSDQPSLLPSTLSVELVGLVGSAVCIGGVFVVIMGIVLAAMTWLYRLGWGNVDDEEDDVEEIDVEIID